MSSHGRVFQLAEAARLRERLAGPPRPIDTSDALRLAGLPLRGPWPVDHVVVRGERVQADPEPGWLVVDGRRRYSGAWL
jgi:hypothetical protein